jgi:hypothetical protein
VGDRFSRLHRDILREVPLARPLLALGLLLITAATATAADGMKVELNKLEDNNGGCRAYVVFENASASSFDSFKLDLVMFAPSGVIARRLAVEAGPLRAAKTSVKLFDVAGLACSEIGQVLVNDVIGCRDGGTERADCVALVELSSKTPVRFVK